MKVSEQNEFLAGEGQHEIELLLNLIEALNQIPEQLNKLNHPEPVLEGYHVFIKTIEGSINERRIEVCKLLGY
jgi:hypothetical protein